ncbi:MAG: ArsR/SmtB family transcription factor [Anaerolineae bacterium]
MTTRTLIGPHSILPPEPVAGVVKLAPAYNVLTSIALLKNNDQSADLGEWVVKTTAELEAKLTRQQMLVSWGIGLECLANAINLDSSELEFPAYLQALNSADPIQLRDRIWHSMRFSSHMRVLLDGPNGPMPENLLQDRDAYVLFFAKEFNKLEKAFQPVPYETYQQTFDLLNDPPELQQLLASHLSELWQTHVAEEWGRIRPMLQDSVDAFQRVDFENLPIFEMVQKVTRRDVRAFFKEEELLKFREIQFVPSVHNGPYIMWSGQEDVLRLTFSAYIPQGIPSRSASQLNQTELLNRLKALADENRIMILNALREDGELSTQEIMERFELSKSAASRHLRQLGANSLIDEIRAEDGVKKFYRLNQEHGEKTLASLAGLLQPLKE